MLERALVYLVSTGVALSTVTFVNEHVLTQAFCLDDYDATPAAHCAAGGAGGSGAALDRLVTALQGSAPDATP